MNNTGLYINRATFVKSKQGAVTDDYIIGKVLYLFNPVTRKGSIRNSFRSKNQRNGKNKSHQAN